MSKADITLSELAGTKNNATGQTVTYAVRFNACGTFSAVRKAEEFLEELGYTIGSMERNAPIGFANDEEIEYVSKWNNMTGEEHGTLDGVMLSNDFREGSVDVIFVKAPKL